MPKLGASVVSTVHSNLEPIVFSNSGQLPFESRLLYVKPFFMQACKRTGGIGQFEPILAAPASNWFA